jgi:hypothetical protein
MALSIPTHMTISTALAVSLVLVTATACLTMTLRLYCALTRGQRRDVIRLATALMRTRAGGRKS